VASKQVAHSSRHTWWSFCAERSFNKYSIKSHTIQQYCITNWYDIL